MFVGTGNCLYVPELIPSCEGFRPLFRKSAIYAWNVGLSVFDLLVRVPSDPIVLFGLKAAIEISPCLFGKSSGSMDLVSLFLPYLA